MFIKGGAHLKENPVVGWWSDIKCQLILHKEPYWRLLFWFMRVGV